MDKVNTSINYLPTLDEFGLVNSNLVQINSARSVGVATNTNSAKTDNFLAGVMDFSISIADKQRFSPYRSYFRAEVELNVRDAPTGDYRQPTMTDNFALAENFVNNIIANSYFYIGSTSVASQSQYHGQSAALRIRLSRSWNWLRSIGKTVYFMDPDFASRQKTTASDGNLEDAELLELGFTATNTQTWANEGTKTRLTFAIGAVATATLPTPLDGVIKPGDYLKWVGSNKVQVLSVDNNTNSVLVTPQIAGGGPTVMSTTLTVRTRDLQQITEQSDGRNSIQVCFQPPLSVFANQQVYPAGSYRVSLFPKADKIAAFQYTTSTATGNTIPPSNISLQFKNLYFFAFVFTAETSFQSGTWYLGLNELDIQAKPMNLSANDTTPATTTHTMNIPSSTLGIATWFQDTSAGTATALNTPPSVFKNSNGTSQNLKTLQLVYSSMSKPVQLYTTEYSGDTQEIVQRYYSAQQNCNLDTIGGESFDHYLTRGNVYYYSYLRPADDRSTNLQITAEMGGLTGNTHMFVAAFYRKLCAITVSDGYVTDVQALAV